MLIAAQRENDCLSKENRKLKNNFNELIENQNKMEVWDIWIVIKLYYIYCSIEYLQFIGTITYELFIRYHLYKS